MRQILQKSKKVPTVLTLFAHMEHDAGAALSVERIFGLKSREFQNLRPVILSKQIIQGKCELDKAAIHIPLEAIGADENHLDALPMLGKSVITRDFVSQFFVVILRDGELLARELQLAKARNVVSSIYD